MDGEVRFLEWIGPGLASVSHGGRPVLAYDHRFSSHSHELRMHDLVNSCEGERRIEPVVVILSPNVSVGVTRADSGAPRVDGGVASIDGQALCFECVEEHHFLDVVLADELRYAALATEARSTMNAMFACFENESRRLRV